jgi:hypothetical protein
MGTVRAAVGCLVLLLVGCSSAASTDGSNLADDPEPTEAPATIEPADSGSIDPEPTEVPLSAPPTVVELEETPEPTTVAIDPTPISDLGKYSLIEETDRKPVADVELLKTDGTPLVLGARPDKVVLVYLTEF